MSINTGANISKLVGYAAAGLNAGIDVTKLVGYAAAGLNAGSNVSKIVAYCAVKTGDADRTTSVNMVWLS